MQRQFKGLLALGAAMILVGSSVAVGRLLVSNLPLYFASMVRFALASLVLVPLVILVEGRFPRVGLRTLAILFSQAICGSFLFTVCLFAGLRLTGAAEAGVMAAATPAAVALLGWILFHDRLGKRAIAGICSTMGGIAILQAGVPTAAAGPNAVLGNGLILCAVGVEAVFLLLRRAIKEPLSSLTAAMWVSLLGLILFLLPGLWEAKQITRAALSAAALVQLTYYGLGVTVAAYILWFYGVVRVEAATAGVVTGIMPVAALFFATWLCDETIGAREIFGCLGVLIGIGILSGIGKSKTPLKKTAPLHACKEGRNI